MPKNAERNENGETFAEWLAAVDRLIGHKCGLTHRDFVDFPSYDTWNDGATPADALEVLAEWDELFAAIVGEI